MPTPLETILTQHFQEHPPLSVKKFIMELALYHPDHGYYRSQRVFGKEGDYNHSP